MSNNAVTHGKSVVISQKSIISAAETEKPEIYKRFRTIKTQTRRSLFLVVGVALISKLRFPLSLLLNKLALAAMLPDPPLRNLIMPRYGQKIVKGR